MLTFTNPSTGPHRRDFLRLGGLAMGGLGLTDLLRLRAQANARPRSEHKAVIFVYLFGGPSHVDSYDMKPDAPPEYRGEFRPTRTNVPGFDFCELMPRHPVSRSGYRSARDVSGPYGAADVRAR